MCKTAKFEGATSYKRVKIQFRKGTKIYRRLYGGGNKLAMSKAEKKNLWKGLSSLLLIAILFRNMQINRP